VSESRKCLCCLSEKKLCVGRFTEILIHFKNPYLIYTTSGISRDTGLKPKFHDLVLSMGENKTLNLKDIPSLKLLQDIMLLISISSFVLETVRA
jgi:hypothetical protein